MIPPARGVRPRWECTAQKDDQENEQDSVHGSPRSLSGDKTCRSSVGFLGRERSWCSTRARRSIRMLAVILQGVVCIGYNLKRVDMWCSISVSRRIRPSSWDAFGCLFWMLAMLVQVIEPAGEAEVTVALDVTDDAPVSAHYEPDRFGAHGATSCHSGRPSRTASAAPVAPDRSISAACVRQKETDFHL